MMWTNHWILIGLAVMVAMLMMTVDGTVVSLLRPFGIAANWIIWRVSAAGYGHNWLVPTGIAAIILLIAYLVDVSTPRSRIFGWLAGASAFVFISIALSGILTNFIKFVIGRARPNSAESLMWPEFHPFAISGSFHSFPSGHSNTVFVVAVSVGLLVPPLRIWLLAMATVISVCRILQFQHFPSDVLAGALLAFVTTYWLHEWLVRNGIVFRAYPDGRVTITTGGRLLRRSLKRLISRRG